jgi:hypothetical protein
MEEEKKTEQDPPAKPSKASTIGRAVGIILALALLGAIIIGAIVRKYPGQ